MLMCKFCSYKGLFPICLQCVEGKNKYDVRVICKLWTTPIGKVCRAFAWCQDLVSRVLYNVKSGTCIRKGVESNK
jgi:hypothetical protein